MCVCVFGKHRDVLIPFFRVSFLLSAARISSAAYVRSQNRGPAVDLNLGMKHTYTHTCVATKDPILITLYSGTVRES